MKAIINVRIYDYQNYIENGFVVFDKEIVKVGTGEIMAVSSSAGGSGDVTGPGTGVTLPPFP